MNGKTALQVAIDWNKHALVNGWESMKSEAKAAREERARKVMIITLLVVIEPH